VAVVAENGEHGSQMAPIARDLIQRYLEKYAASSSLNIKKSDTVKQMAHVNHIH
jgi:hypothetical protein